MSQYSYREEENVGKMPDGDKVLVQAMDRIETRSVFQLSIKHVQKRDPFGVAKRGFVASITAGGLTNTESEVFFGEVASPTAKRSGAVSF